VHRRRLIAAAALTATAVLALALAGHVVLVLAGRQQRLPLLGVAAVGAAVVTAALISSVRHHARTEHAAPEASGLGFTVPLTLVVIAAAIVAPDAFRPSDIGRLQLIGLAVTLGLLVAWMVLRPAIGDPVARAIDWLAARLPEEPFQPQLPGTATSKLFWVLSAALGAVAVAGIALLVSNGPLGHDEAVYAVKARSWLEGTPASGFEIYRPIGMPVVGWALLHLGDSEAVLRSFGVVSSALALGGLWFFGRSVFSPAAGLLAAGLFVGAPDFVRRAPEFLNDVAAAALLVLVMGIVWHFLDRSQGRGWSVVWAAPLAAAAFYLRYGAVTSLLMICVVAAALWWRATRDGWRQITLTGGIFIALLIPHAVTALAETGSVFGILTRANEAAGREYLGEGFLTYLRWLPGDLAGDLVGTVMITGTILLVVVAARSILRRSLTSESRRVLFVGLAAWLMIVAGGITVHAEERYVFLSVMLLTLLGSHTLLRMARWLPHPITTICLVVVVGLVALQFAVSFHTIDGNLDDLAVHRQVLVDAAAAIDDASPGSCSVATSYTPQITWYSGCATTTFGWASQPAQFAPAPDRYVLLFDNGKRQPTGEHLEEYLSATSGSPFVEIDAESDRIGDAEIYRVTEATP